MNITTTPGAEAQAPAREFLPAVPAGIITGHHLQAEVREAEVRALQLSIITGLLEKAPAMLAAAQDTKAPEPGAPHRVPAGLIHPHVPIPLAAVVSVEAAAAIQVDLLPEAGHQEVHPGRDINLRT